jgi:type I restriction enzyme S subunit
VSLRTVSLSDVLEDARPGFACGDDVSDGVFQFRMNNITTEGTLDLSRKRRVPRETRKLDSFLLRRGDVLFNATNSPELVGKAAPFLEYDEPAVFSNHFLRLRPKADKLDGRFLARWLNVQFQRGVFKGLCRQWVNQATVGRDSLLSLKLPLPPLAEQRRIAEVLDRAEALRAKRRAALAQLDTLTQALFLDLFGDPGVNPKGWPLRRFDTLLAMPLRNGLSPSRRGTVVGKVLTLSAITGPAFDARAWKSSLFESIPPSQQTVAKGDFLICRGNGNPGLVGRGHFPTRSMPDVAFPDTMIAAHVAHGVVEREFLEHVWNSHAVRRQVASLARTTNGTFKVNQQMLEGILFIDPPLHLQREFANATGNVQDLRATQLASLAHLDALFASLQHRAFRGEL